MRALLARAAVVASITASAVAPIMASIMALGAIGLAHGAVPADDDADQSERERALRQMWTLASDALEQASDALEPPLTPPVPRAVRWQAQRISSIALGAPLLDLGAGDLDGDGRAELIALTADEVLIIERRGHRTLDVRARVSLPAEPATIRPRDPVGALVVADTDGDGRAEIAARSSLGARAAVYVLERGALVAAGGAAGREPGGAAGNEPGGAAGNEPGGAAGREPGGAAGSWDGFPQCAGMLAELEPGKNYFVKALSAVPALAAWALPERFYAARCRAGMVDPAGRALSARGVVAVDGSLSLTAERRCRRRDVECQSTAIATRTVPDVGTVFEIADVDGDGYPEVLITAAVPPGEPDRITVLSWRADRMLRVFERELSGGVMGLTAADLDGDGAIEVIAAVRLWGSSRVDLWTLVAAAGARAGARPAPGQAPHAR